MVLSIEFHEFETASDSQSHPTDTLDGNTFQGNPLEGYTFDAKNKCERTIINLYSPDLDGLNGRPGSNKPN